MSDWRYGFQLKTKRKLYILFAQTDIELKKWTFAFNIILKRIPEAFPKIRENVFKKALEYFERPYLQEIRRKEMEEERKIRMREEEKIRKGIEEEQILRSKLENEERKRKILEEQLEENKRRLREEEQKSRLGLQDIKNNKRLYYNKNASIFSDLDNNDVSVTDDAAANDSNLSYISHSDINRSYNNNYSPLNFKDDIEDWNFYNECDEKIDEKDLIVYNPIAKDTHKDKFSKKEDEKEYLKGIKGINSLYKIPAGGGETHLNSTITLNITSTKEDFTQRKIIENENEMKKELDNNTSHILIEELQKS
jgi:hypothetical protein